jgi:tetratricopeptide (TPR) repeat protein
VILRRRLGDRAELRRVLRALGEAYKARDRWHRVLDTLDWIFTTFQQDPPDYAGMAGTLAEIGTTMITVERPDSAADYLKRAVTAYGKLAEPAPIGHAAALVSWGNLLWSQGTYGQARRKFSAALALLVDIDDTLAEQARELLRQPRNKTSGQSRIPLSACSHDHADRVESRLSPVVCACRFITS